MEQQIFDFSHLISDEMLEKVRRRKAEIRNELNKTALPIPERFKIIEPNKSFRVKRYNEELDKTNYRYYKSKADMFEHLRNIGYIPKFIEEILDQTTGNVITLPTPDEDVSYIIEELNEPVRDKFHDIVKSGLKIWNLDIPNLDYKIKYYMDDDSNVYRETINIESIVKLTPDSSNGVRIKDKGIINVYELWKLFKGEQYERGD